MKRNNCRTVFATLALIAVAGCRSSETDLSSDPGFVDQVGQQWSLLSDCNVFQFKSQRDDQVYLGPTGPHGMNYDPCNIFGELPKGTKVSVVAIRRIQTFEHDHYVFDLRPMSTHSNRWPLLNGLWMVERRFPPGGLDTNIAERTE